MTDQKVFYTRAEYLKLEKRYAKVIKLLIEQLKLTDDEVDLGTQADVIFKAEQELKKTWQELS